MKARRAAEIIREDGIRALLKRGTSRILDGIYRGYEMISVERSLHDLEPRYGLKGGITVHEIWIDDIRNRRYPMPPDVLVHMEDTMREGCRIFVALKEGALTGVMVVGKKWSLINKVHQYEKYIRVGEKDMVNFQIVILPKYRKTRAVGVLKESVLLQLKEEGYERVLGAIDATNRPSLSLARHFGFKEVKRVRLYKLLFIRLCFEKKPVPSAPVPLDCSVRVRGLGRHLKNVGS